MLVKALALRALLFAVMARTSSSQESGGCTATAPRASSDAESDIIPRVGCFLRRSPDEVQTDGTPVPFSEPAPFLRRTPDEEQTDETADPDSPGRFLRRSLDEAPTDETPNRGNIL